MTKRTLLLLSVLAAGAASCDPPLKPIVVPPPPAPGTGRLVVRLETPHEDDGAILLEIRGRRTGPAHTTDTTLWLSGETVDSTLSRFLIAGDLSSGALFEIEVPDVTAVGIYSATITAAADRGSSVRSSLEGYRLTITRD
jgi:hypothetical protein